MGKSARKQYVVCVDNQAYRASLVVRRIYKCLPDADAARRGLIRVIDESGEDYLYPSELFLPIDLPKTMGKVFSLAT